VTRLNLLRTSLTAAFLVILGGFALVQAQNGTGKVNSRAAYLSPSQLNFIRPGLSIKVTGAEIASDGTITARFKLTDSKGQGLDREGIETPGAISVTLIAAYIPKGATQYRAYTTRSQTSPITGATAVQASGESNGTFTKVGDGEYTYKFATKAQNVDRTVTHTIGAYGSRNLTEFDLGTQYDDTTYNFVPDGSAVKVTRDVIQTATCNKCHYDMAFHGGPRKTMEVCVLCHQPQTVDPDTGNSVDMVVMTHKIHMGSSLPSVEAGTPYKIIGNRQSVHDYSEVVFPADARNCLVCHEQGKAAQSDAVFKPNRTACGACHDNVNFATGENHVDLPQISDNQCANCHVKETDQEFDASILGAHTIPRFAKALPGVVLDILEVTDAAPGKYMTVAFSIKDKAGNPIHPSKMSRLNFRLAGPTTDYTTQITEDARKADGVPGQYFWTFLTPLPANANGSWGLSLEGRADITVMPGTKKQQVVRDTGVNKTVYISVGGGPVVPRRTVVATEKCNACHFKLAAHGDSRNQTENCVICHNPTLVAGSGAAAQPVEFATMIHKIHRGRELVNQYKVGNTSFNEVGYPGDLRNCSACHVNGSEQLPLADNLVAVKTPNAPLNPMPKATAACLGCHDNLPAAAHAAVNISSLGETCSTCHSSTSDFSVSKVHAQ
jgi:OmcA/MtrC family decaheme c-type cytochrome